MFNILILGIASLLTDISSEMVYPLLPLYLTGALGASPATLGLIEGIAESLASLLKVFSGHISDRLGRRKYLAISGYAFSTVGKMFLYFSVSWWWVLWGRITDRFGKGIRTAPRDALIAEAVIPEQRGEAFGLHRAMDTFGAVTGIILAYYLFTKYQGEILPVFLLSLFPAFAGVAVLFLVREKDGAPATGRKFDLNWAGLDPRLKMFLTVVLLFTLGNSSNQFLLLRAQSLGFDAGKVILLYLTYNVVYSLTSYPAGYFSDRIGRRTILVAGHVAFGLVYLGFAVVEKPGHVWWLFAAYGLYSGFTEGVSRALIADIAPPQQKATLLGLHATLVGIGLLPASLLAGFLWAHFGPGVPFYFSSFTALTAAVALWVALGRQKERVG